MTIVEAQNLNDRDGKTTPDAGIAKWSDAYVRVQVGIPGFWSTRETSRIGNENKYWLGKKLSMGWHRSGEALVLFQVLDYDTGLELVDGGDDLLGAGSFWLPFCSSLAVEYNHSVCDERGCVENDMPWVLQRRKLCREEAWIRLSANASAAIRVIIEIVPFQVHVVEGEDRLSTTLFVNQRNGGRLNSTTSPLDAGGALLLQTTSHVSPSINAQLALNGQLAIYAELSINAEATLTLCRPTSCHRLPDWLREWEYVLSIPIMQEEQSLGYSCCQHDFDPAARDQYGIITQNIINLGWPECEMDYFVIFEPHFGTGAKGHRWQNRFKRIALLVRLIQLGTPLLIYLSGALRLLSKCKFRLHRLGAHMLTPKKEGGRFTGVAISTSLFQSEGISMNNGEFRHNYYWATRCALNMLAVPWIVFWTSGIIITMTVRPPHVGIFIILIGTAIQSLAFALALWKLERWRLTRSSLNALVCSMTCSFCFLIVIVVFGPSLASYDNYVKQKIDFLSFATVLLTLGLIPFTLEVMEFNADICRAKSALVRALKYAATLIKSKHPDGVNQDYWLMKECYSASSSSPYFDFVPDIAGHLCGFSNCLNSREMAAVRCALLRTVSRLVFLVLVVGAFMLTPKGYLALVYTLFLSLTDAVHSNLNLNCACWSPSKTVYLMIASRAIVVLIDTRFWILGLSMVYCVYGISLLCNIVNKRLPYIDHLEACSMIFLATRSKKQKVVYSPSFDVASTPEGALLVLTATLFVITLVAEYANPSGLSLPHMRFSNHAELPTRVIPIVVWLFVAFAGSVHGYIRAAYLDTQSLLMGGAAMAYVVTPSFNLPKILASLAYLCLIAMGLLLWGASEAPAALAVCAIGPLCAISFVRTFSIWLANDCEVITWPPVTGYVPKVDDSESKLAFEVLQVMMNKPQKRSEGVKTLRTLHMPHVVRVGTENQPAEDTVQMPVLPPKSIIKQRAFSLRRLYSLPAATLPQRRKVVELGLHACRVTKLKRSLNDDSHKRKECKSLPNLTLIEICTHCTGLICKSMTNEPYAWQTADQDWFEIPLWEAILTGCLLPDEYMTVICVVLVPLLVMVLGGLLSHLAYPPYTGHLLWTVSTFLFLTMFPIIKWFKTYEAEWNTIVASLVGYLLFVGTLGWAYKAWLDARIDVVEAVWLIDALILYPVGLYKLCQVMAWVDNGYKDQGSLWGNPKLNDSRNRKSDSGNFSVSPIFYRLYLGLVQIANHLLVVFILAQIYLWSSPVNALACCFTLLLFVGTSYFICTWAENAFYLPPNLLHSSDIVIGSGSIVMILCVAVVTGSSSILILSFFFVLQLCKCIIKIMDLVHLDTDRVYWFAPTLFPVYSYSAQNGTLVDETQLTVHCVMFCGIGLCWTTVLACFSQCISLGTTLFFFFISLVVSVFTNVCSQVPLKMGVVASYPSSGIFVDAALATLRRYEGDIRAETSKFEVHCDEWDGPEGQHDVNHHESNSQRHSNPKLTESKPISTGDSDFRSSAQAIAMRIDAAECALRLVTLGNEQQPIWRADAIYTDRDALAETCASRGPFGYIGSVAWIFYGFELKTLCSCLRDFDKEGQRVLAQDTVEMEAMQAILYLLELDASFCNHFTGELKALAHFHFLVITSNDAHLTHKQITFKKFVRESRFKLISNGILPPNKVLQAPDSTMLNMRLAASWLQSLGHDQRERFYLLQDNFTVEQIDHELKVDQQDRDEIVAARALSQMRAHREQENAAKRISACLVRRSKRTLNWLASLRPEDKKRFMNVLQRQWESNMHPTIETGDEPMRKSYQLHVLLNNDETLGNCRERLAELEAGESDCYPSRARKGTLQFIDPEFQPSESTLGPCFGANFIGTWNHALSVNPHAVLFAEGGEPDDVRPGACVNDNWLIAVLSMLSTVGVKDDADAGAQIKKLFINMIDLEGNIIYDSAIGAFGLQLFANGQWEAVVVDDALPMLGDGSGGSGIDALVALDTFRREQNSFQYPDCVDQKLKLNVAASIDSILLEAYKERYKDCAGFAIAHVSEMAELWLSLLEKGVAKYYGSYGAIESGFVHQGLELLTGNRAECLHIAQASRGFGKRALWGSLLRSHRSDYILGASAIPAEHAALSLHLSGLVFGATYTIYDIIDVFPERHKLIKLRNPAGHTEIFRGAWSHSSTLWTKRLRNKLFHGLEPHTFWMSFDEFCCVFRCIFICHYYTENSLCWKRQCISGEWTRGHPDNRENTAPGLPSLHNPCCEVERNPQYSVVIHRPTTLRVSVEQVHTKGHAAILPVASYLCRATRREDSRVNRITKLENHNLISSTGRARRERVIETCVDCLDRGVYVILVGAFQAEMEGHFTLSVISNNKVLIAQIWPPTWRSQNRQVTVEQKHSGHGGAD